MPTNFDLAPASRTVDGLLAVPIDIQHIEAMLIFDGATLTGTATAAIDFIVGPGGGCPIFDLRQTITGAILDGTAVAPTDVALHDFGGGVGADLRVLNRVLTAGSSHTLQVTYSLGTPQASTAGRYQPAMTWSAGPRLAFNFGFTDLESGRHLESWVPANLIFDQFSLTLELQVLNTAVAHTPITNGTVTVLGANQWSIAFPATITALSPLVELRAADTVVSATSTVVLPISGQTITLEAWKLATSATDLAARVGDIATLLVANEASTGRRGAAAMVGPTVLNADMSAFLKANQTRPATTVALEEHLFARSTAPALVDGFYRFVDGFADPSPLPDLWIKDDPGDPGSHLWAGTFWNSPDLWIRNVDDGGLTHQAPEYGQDNWFHARVRNRSASGPARHFVVTFNAQSWVGTEFVFPSDFLPCTAAVAGFDLGPGETRIVKARWPRTEVPLAGTHVCWVAAALSRADQPSAGNHVWEHNNLAQKNLMVVDAVPGRWIIVPFVIDRLLRWRRRGVKLQIYRPPRAERLEAAVLHDGSLFTAAAEQVMVPGAAIGRAAADASLQCGGPARVSVELPFAHGKGQRFASGARAEVGLQLAGHGSTLLGLALRVPEGTPAGESAQIDLLEYDEALKRVVGGVSVIVRVGATGGRS